VQQGRTVTGEVVFPESNEPGSAVVYVRVEETSMADAPSRVVGETVAPVELPCRSLTFAVPVTMLDDRADYSVRVHVDRDQDGRVSPGDFVSTMSHPVLTHGHGDTVTVPVRAV
jgi:uncharacterized lipoprotein YbaY